MNRLIIIFLLFFCLSSCKDDTNNIKKKTSEIEVKATSFTKIGKELLKNKEFRNWRTNAKPSNWEINEKVEVPENFVVDRDTLDLMLVGKKDDYIYIQQTLDLKPNTSYVLKADICENLKSNSYAGIVIRDESNIIGKRIFKKEKNCKYDVLFKTDSNKKVSIYIGFIDQGEGRVFINSISLKEVKVNDLIFSSIIAQTFSNNLSLDLSNEKTFDKSIPKIIRYTSDLMLAKKRKDSTKIHQTYKLLDHLNKSFLFSKYLKMPPKEITKSYPSKLVFSSIEILSEFNIGTQRIELFKDKKRIHQALRYYNPFSKKWIIIDPFYNSILKNNDLSKIGEDDILFEEMGGRSKNVKGLLTKYSKSKAIVKKEIITGYPF